MYGTVQPLRDNAHMADLLPTDSPELHPRVFVSYSSESALNDWVTALCERLVGNGVDVIYDLWDVAAGSDLPHFMESGLTGADRILVISSDEYVRKANEGIRGTGYEKKIMSAPMMTNAVGNRIVPVIRNATGEGLVPTFLSGVRYLDFRDDSMFEVAYSELVHELFGRRVSPRPALGRNPFAEASETLTRIAIAHDAGAYRNEALAGEVEYPYENNDGSFAFGSGVQRFTLKVTGSGPGSVHVYSDPADIKAIALAPATSSTDIGEIDTYDFSSRSRTARVGDSVVLVNTSGRVATVEVTRVSIRETSDDRVPRLSFRYQVLAED